MYTEDQIIREIYYFGSAAKEKYLFCDCEPRDILFSYIISVITFAERNNTRTTALRNAAIVLCSPVTLIVSFQPSELQLGSGRKGHQSPLLHLIVSILELKFR